MYEDNNPFANPHAHQQHNDGPYQGASQFGQPPEHPRDQDQPWHPYWR